MKYGIRLVLSVLVMGLALPAFAKEKSKATLFACGCVVEERQCFVDSIVPAPSSDLKAVPTTSFRNCGTKTVLMGSYINKVSGSLEAKPLLGGASDFSDGLAKGVNCEAALQRLQEQGQCPR
ncbi:hypothetical protein K2X30_00645 [bacterium]|nr:hypothetical protein [bacterium]